MVYSTRRFVVCLSVCHFVLVFFSPFSIAITSLGEERANLSAFRTFVRFVLVWICRFPLPRGLGRAAVCDCGTPWTFLLPFFAWPEQKMYLDQNPQSFLFGSALFALIQILYTSTGSIGIFGPVSR